MSADPQQLVTLAIMEHHATLKAHTIVDQFIPGHSICTDRSGLVAAIAKALAEKV